MSGQDAQQLLQKLTDAAKEDPRKTGARRALMVMAIMLGRTLMSGDLPVSIGHVAVRAQRPKCGWQLRDSVRSIRPQTASRQATHYLLIDLDPAATSRANNSAKKLREWMVCGAGQPKPRVKILLFPLRWQSVRWKIGLQRTGSSGEGWESRSCFKPIKETRENQPPTTRRNRPNCASCRFDTIIWAPIQKAMVERELVA